MTYTHCILAIDTATGPCSVAVWKEQRIAAYLEVIKPAMQSASLMPLVEDALLKADASYGDLTAIACTTGPGSFTGIRVGLAAARGICLATGLRGLGFTTLHTLAFAARKRAALERKPVLAVLNAGKGEWYHQSFDSDIRPQSEPALGTQEQIIASFPPPSLIAGNQLIEGYTATDIPFPRADALAELAASHGNLASELSPFYIRPPDAKPQAKNI